MRSTVDGYWPASAPPSGIFRHSGAALTTGGEAPPDPDPGSSSGYGVVAGVGVTVYRGVTAGTPYDGVEGGEISSPKADGVVF